MRISFCKKALSIAGAVLGLSLLSSPVLADNVLPTPHPVPVVINVQQMGTCTTSATSGTCLYNNSSFPLTPTTLVVVLCPDFTNQNLTLDARHGFTTTFTNITHYITFTNFRRIYEGYIMGDLNPGLSNPAVNVRCAYVLFSKSQRLSK